MTQPLVVINKHKRIEEAYEESEQYLKDHPELRDVIAIHLWAYYEVGDLFPITAQKLDSGHRFPYSESYYQLESSFELCMEGFYQQALFALRCVLELGVLGLYFDRDNSAEVHIRGWYASAEQTPRFKRCLRALFQLRCFEQFNQVCALKDQIKELMGLLDDHAHTRGYYFSAWAKARADVNTFSKSALQEYVETMKRVVTGVITMILLKYPVGMQGLPLWDKFGSNPPAGGFLDETSHRAVWAVIDEGAKQVLKDISDNDPDVIMMVENILSMPDLTEEQLKAQSAEFEDWPAMPRGKGKVKSGGTGNSSA